MTSLVRAVFVFLTLGFGAHGAMAQNRTGDIDSRQIALDVYSGINRGTEPATIALKLREAIELFRYRCTRVTDYQVFTQRPNITDIKVKCSGDPLYGVTVASNGFVSVYGGNSILAPLDRRDAVIYSLDAEGEVEDSGFDIERIKEETKSRVMLGSEYDYMYLAGMLLVILAMVTVGAYVFIRIFKKNQSRRPRRRMKPMPKFRVGFASDVKDKLIEESEEIGQFVYKHKSGLYIAIGGRGKRRLFLSAFWAQMYVRHNTHFFEASEDALAKLDIHFDDDAEIVAGGEEVRAPN